MPDSNIVPITSATAPRYKYYTVDIVSNKIVGEIPFEDVSYERSLKQPGAFEGKITISEQTNNLDLYNSTMPGRTALYVVRDNVATWGGIIWGRTYDLTGRSLAISATEFTSYLSHRVIWKAYSNVYNCDLYKETKTSPVLVIIKNAFLKAPLATADSYGNPNKVEVTFVANNDRKYTGFYPVLGTSTLPAAIENPQVDSFYVDIPKLPVPTTGVYNSVSVNVRVDTYGYLRDLLDNVFNDFINLDFPNEIIEPGITKQISIVSKQLTITNNIYGVATIQCDEPHSLVVGQRIELANVDRMLDGIHTVTELPTTKSVKFIVNNPVDIRNRNVPIFLDNTLSTAVNTASTIQRTPIYMRESVDYLKENVTHVKRVSGVVTLTLASPHRFELGTKITTVMANKKPVMMPVYDATKKKNVSTNTLMYNGNQALEITAVTDTTISYVDPKYTSSKYNIALTQLSPLDSNKNYVQSSEARGFLRIYSKESHGFNINDRIRVEGVDSISWNYPRYNGNHRIYEVDGGVPFIVDKYEVVSDAVYGTIIKFYLTKTNSLGVDKSINCREGDNFLITGMEDSRDHLNGTYRAIKDVEQSGSYWIVSADGPSDVTALTVLSENPTLSMNGMNWVQYFPVQSELRGALTKEPDTIFPVTNLKYTPAKGKTPNLVTITTNGRHLLSVGDSVKVELSTVGTNTKDQEIYGGIFTVTAVNDADKFSYSLRSVKDGKTVTLPTVAVNQPKEGSITRFKTNLEISKELVTARIISVATIQNADSQKAYVYSPNHNLSEGDTIRIMFDHKYFPNLSNNGEDIVINEVLNENTFSYITDGQIGKNKQFPILGVEFDSSAALKAAYPLDANTAVANSIYYRVKGYGTVINQPEVTVNVTSISVGNYGIYGNSGVITTITSDVDLTNLIKPGAGAAGAATGNEIGTLVTFDNFPAATYGSQTPTPTHPVITGFSYNAASKGIIFTCQSPHGLLFPYDYNALFTMSGPTYITYPNYTDKVGHIYMGGLYNSTLRVIQVLDDYRFVALYPAFGTSNFVAKNLTTLNSALTPNPTYPTLTGVSQSNYSMTFTFASAHNLDPVLDINANIDISGFASTVSSSNNSTGATLDTSWINSTWTVKSIPNANSVTVYCGYTKPTFSIYNIGVVGSPTNTTFTRTATNMSYTVVSGSNGKLGISLSSPLPITPNANTTVTINSMNSSAVYPYDTGRVGGVNTTVIPGAKTLYPAESSASYLVVDQSGYSANLAIYGSAAASAQMTITQTSSGSFVPVPSITLTPANRAGSAPIDSFLAYNARQIELTPDLTKYNKIGIVVRTVDGNDFTFIDTVSGGGGYTVNVASVSPKVTAFVPAQTWTSTNAPLITPDEKMSIVGMQDDYAFLNDFYVNVLDYWPGASVGGVPTAYIRVKNNYYTDSRKTMPANKISGLPDTASAFGSTALPGTAWVVPSSSYSGSVDITHISRSVNGLTATITAPNHNFVVGEEVYVDIIGLDYAAFSQNLQRIKIESVTADTFSYTMASSNKVKSFSGNASVPMYGMYGLNEIKFGGNGAHNIVAGDTVSITGISAYVNGEHIVENTSVGSITIHSDEPSDFVNKSAITGRVSVTTYTTVDADVSGVVIPAPVAIREPQMLYRTYGEYPSNSSIGGLTFSDNNYSSKTSTTTPIYGSQLLTVAEILEGYSNTLDGFDYRIDVSLVSNLDGTKTFNRKFMLIPIYPASLTEYLLTLPSQKLAKGQVAHPKAFGADKLIFEYPGNISNLSMSENAESSATRVFVVGNDNKTGSGSEVAYSGAADTTLLSDGWPVLDKKEVKEWPIQTAQSAFVDPIDNYDDETAYWQYADRFLRESKPPIGDFVISVNGSLNPVIGAYNPGDWCSIVINDNFVKNRLNSVLEPRKDVIVRKIDSIKVQVPNNPAFPEQIDLQLVTDWQVDKIGE